METENIQPGDEIDGFRILDKVHEGSMATLYRVAGADDRPLLMKVPKLGFGSHPACYVGFEVEQMILEKLAGPHVPRFVAKGGLEARPYIVMEHVAGPTLKEALPRAPLPAREIALLGAALADALHDLHRQDVVHLDVKPANILFRPGGAAVLIDFGLARHGHLPDLVEEEFHAPVGTGAYISPEQIMGVRCDPRSDIFALGVILYELATGSLPFGSPTTRQGFRQRLYRAPVPPRALVPAVPEWLQEIILHCLEVRWQDRYATAAQVAADLRHSDQVPITARGNLVRRPPPTALFRRWLDSLRLAPPPCPAPSVHVGTAPHILVAVDTGHEDAALERSLREAVLRMVAAEPHSRVSCVTVLEPSILTEEDEGRELAHSLYTQRLVELRHWAAPLGLSQEKLRFHVLEAGDPAQALVDYASRNHVDSIVMGARGKSALRRFLGSVSSRVVAEAPCSVTVVRAKASIDRRDEEG